MNELFSVIDGLFDEIVDLFGGKDALICQIDGLFDETAELFK